MGKQGELQDPQGIVGMGRLLGFCGGRRGVDEKGLGSEMALSGTGTYSWGLGRLASLAFLGCPPIPPQAPATFPGKGPTPAQDSVESAT